MKLLFGLRPHLYLQLHDHCILTHALHYRVKLFQDNKQCESFFLVENILLRPLVETKYELIIFTDDKQKKLVSYYNAEFNELRDLRDDLWHIVIKAENFSIEKDAKTGKNIVVVYDLFNNPILKSEKH